MSENEKTTIKGELSDASTCSALSAQPWKQATRGPNGCPIIGDRKGVMVCMLAHSANESRQKETAEANANLIAAAPELLSALIEMRDWYADFTGLPASRANAAINKAIQ